MDKSPCYGGLACKGSQSTEQNWADCLAESSKEKQTQALSLSLRVWILLKALKLPEKDDSKLLYGGGDGLLPVYWGKGCLRSLRQGGGLAASLWSSAKANTEHGSWSTINPWSNTGSMRVCVCICVCIHTYINITRLWDMVMMLWQENHRKYESCAGNQYP